VATVLQIVAGFADVLGMVELLRGRMVRLLGGQRAANGRALACVWGFGATCLTATILLPHPQEANEAGLIAVVLVAYPVATLMFVKAATLPAGALESFTYLGQLLITVLTFAWGAPDAPFLWFHLWLVVHSFHFLAPLRAMLQVACAALLFVFATFATGAPFAGATSVVGVGSILIIGLLVCALRAQVDELVQALARSAATDPLTGLPNRRALETAYAQAGALRARTGSPGALLVLDCDGLKALNDHHGHVAGDEALMRVARAMSAAVRAVDTPARLGGDEFAILLAATNPGVATAVGERVRSTVACDPDLEGMTLSVGVVELPADNSVELGTALVAADRAMYRSKHGGGDRVSLGALYDTVPADPAESPRCAVVHA
jgi:diguanylate cyclase (GGDEF)-like protein